MRSIRAAFGFLILASLSSLSVGQIATSGKLETLRTLRQDLAKATRFMRPCMPIYQGHRGNSETAVHQAETIVNAAVAAATPPKGATEAPKVLTAAEKAEVAKIAGDEAKKKGEAKKTEAPKPAIAVKTEPVKTEDEKIAASQAGMRKALEAIQKAQKDLKAASEFLPEGQATTVEKLLQNAEAEATKAIALFASKG